MGATVLKWLVLLVVITTFALSNRTPVTVNFWQWTLYSGPLAVAIVGAAVIGALLTYFNSVTHHVRQAQLIRRLQDTVRAHEARQGETASGPRPPIAAPSAPVRPVEDTRRLS